MAVHFYFLWLESSTWAALWRWCGFSGYSQLEYTAELKPTWSNTVSAVLRNIYVYDKDIWCWQDLVHWTITTCKHLQLCMYALLCTLIWMLLCMIYTVLLLLKTIAYICWVHYCILCCFALGTPYLQYVPTVCTHVPPTWPVWPLSHANYQFVPPCTVTDKWKIQCRYVDGIIVYCKHGEPTVCVRIYWNMLAVLWSYLTKYYI